MTYVFHKNFIVGLPCYRHFMTLNTANGKSKTKNGAISCNTGADIL